LRGYILNNSGANMYIFKRNLPTGHKILLEDVWNIFEKKVKLILGKQLVTEDIFIKWLTDNGFMKDGFVYYPGDKETFPGEIMDASSAEIFIKEVRADGRLVKPSLAKASQVVIDKLTYMDLANLRKMDDARRIIQATSSLSKLRKAYTAARNLPKKGWLQNIMRERLQELERTQ
jgi:hypothetical protein